MQSPVCDARVRFQGLEHKLKRSCGTHVKHHHLSSESRGNRNP